MKNYTPKARSRALLLLVVAVAVISGIAFMMASRAAGPFVSAEPESGTLTAAASRVTDTTASAGSAIKFGTVTPPPPPGNSTTPNLKVAFVGDTVLATATKSLLSVIKAENAELLVHLGDFDYQNNPTAFDAQTTSILGANFPIIGVLGNHEDNPVAYEAMIKSRIDRSAGLTCTGSPGVQTDCMFKGLHVVSAAAGIKGTGHDAYIRSKLAASNALWNICSWHTNMNAMQAGTKGNEAGWPVYEECRMGGGMPMAGHEHSYARTKTLTNMTNQTVDPSCANPLSVCVAKGKTFSTVSGLGGRGPIDAQSRCTPTVYPYGCKGEWAKFHSASQGATFSVLFITFHVDGNPNKARGYLKDIAGRVIETFDITRQ